MQPCNGHKFETRWAAVDKYLSKLEQYSLILGLSMNFLGGDVNDADSENWFKFRRADLIPGLREGGAHRRAVSCAGQTKPHSLIRRARKRGRGRAYGCRCQAAGAGAFATV